MNDDRPWSGLEFFRVFSNHVRRIGCGGEESLRASVLLLSLQPAGYNSRMARRSDPFTVIVEQDDEGYYVATVPELRGCHTQAKSLDVLMRRVNEAITLCLADGPRPPRRTFVAVQQVQVG
jgi:predicted RNase H-like HicB family nuclease